MSAIVYLGHDVGIGQLAAMLEAIDYLGAQWGVARCSDTAVKFRRSLQAVAVL